MIILATILIMLIAIAIVILASFPADKWYFNIPRMLVFGFAGIYMGETVVNISNFLESYFK